MKKSIKENEQCVQTDVSGSVLITKDNFKDFIGKKVEPECIGRFAAFLTPDVNILLSYLDGCWYFKSPDEINTTEEVWMYKETEDWTISVYLADSSITDR
jgi:hypothetical protein